MQLDQIDRLRHVVSTLVLYLNKGYCSVTAFGLYCAPGTLFLWHSNADCGQS